MIGDDAYVISIEGLNIVEDFDELPPKVEKALRRAISKTVDRTRTAAARAMVEQVRFPARYLSGSDGRLQVDKSKLNEFVGVIRGRHRATSLARFVSGTPTPGRRGVEVAVKPGGATFLPRAFVMKLRSGTAALDTKSNLGLAVRTSGEKPAAAWKPMKVGSNLWLLYGPSVDQVFKTVRQDVSPEALDFLYAEFSRLMKVEGV